jgi:hypothetical protein
MGLNADAINKLKDILVTEQGGALSYLTNLYFGEADYVTTLTRPYMWIHLGDPALEESWASASDRRQVLFRVQIDVSIQRGDSARSYGVTGDNSKRGFLVATEEVMNRIEANRSSFVAPTLSKSLDIEMTAKSVKDTNNDYVGVIMMTFKQRFAAAGR